MRLAALIFLAGCGGQSSRCADPVMVFAAASLRDALTDAAGSWSGEAHFNFAGSNVLAMQIEATDNADVFVSADMAWMDRLEKGGKLVEGSRQTLLSNRLVLIANADVKLATTSARILLEPSIEYVSMGDPEAVPAGRYAKGWLQEEGIWTEVARKAAPAADVRAAMRLVEADPSILGIVYATDARASDGVRVVFEPANGPEIRYPAALVKRERVCESATDFLEHLDSSSEIFARHGFGMP